MRQILLQARKVLFAYGVNSRQMLDAAANTPRFFRTLLEYQRAPACEQFRAKPFRLHPILHEFSAVAGTASGHYFHQDLWAARKIFAAKPARHFDVGSRVDGFIAHLLVFMPVTLIDIRPLESSVTGLDFSQMDATALSGIADDSVESISSLHAVEHFGLGRYGDPVDPNACFHAMRALARVVKPGGRLYFSVPIGVERVVFNAHRVFAPQTVLHAFQSLRLESFAAVNDDGALQIHATPDHFRHAEFACGMFEFSK